LSEGISPWVQDAKTGRELVDIGGFVPIFVKVRALRNAGQRDGIRAAAISELDLS
jgi:hypothetical protein